MGAFAAAPVLKIRSFQRAPPLLPPSECRDWRGVCKNGLQNLESQGVRSQNLGIIHLTYPYRFGRV
jgi:hypothetical protein